MNKYVAGLMFRTSPTNSSQMEVALILKNHPDWQKGRLNGIGGKINEGEHPVEAMVREFREEAGLDILPGDWRSFCSLGGDDWNVQWFACMAGHRTEIHTMESEPVGFYPLWQVLPHGELADPRLRVQVIPNLRWLVPLALDKDRVFAAVSDESRF